MATMSHSRLQNMSADLRDFRRALRKLHTDPLSDTELDAAKQLVCDCQLTLLTATQLTDSPSLVFSEVLQADFGPVLDALNLRGLHDDEVAAA